MPSSRNEMTIDPHLAAEAAAQQIATSTRAPRHDVAVVLGSGWGPAAAGLGTPSTSIPMSTIPGFSSPTAAGHTGSVQSIEVGEHRVLVLVGRIHSYEGHTLQRVVHPIRTAAACGASTVVLTNAAGGIRGDLAVGQPVLISDHINMTGQSPLVGADFVDMVGAYSPALRELAHSVDDSLAEGVYAGMSGPHYETPAEVRMLRTLGADLVGMSTVHEAIAARASGMQVLGLSLVTNLAAGVTGEHLNHGEVLAAGFESAGPLGVLLAKIIEKL